MNYSISEAHHIHQVWTVIPVIFMSLFVLGCHPMYGQSEDIIELVPITGGFAQPVDIASAGDDRLFIVERRGVIQITDTAGGQWDMPFLDIDAHVNSSGGERGLLGLVFHPNYPENGFFFVNYTNNSGNTTIARFSRSPDDPDLAEPTSEEILMTISQPFGNHNAGDLAFGPDGYLYFGTGDGGSGGDPGDRAQDRLILLGKMLRIDVDSGNPYSIPSDNPFADDDFTADEIWALGLRNPWRFSFDRETGDLWIADVGQDSWEEINMQPADSPGGENYGWRCYEADMQFNLLDCPEMSVMTFPIYAYTQIGANCGGSVTGGFVYRGQRNPDLYGTYIFVDYCKGTFRGLRISGDDVVVEEIYQGETLEYTTFGEDANGEIYVAGASGTIFRIGQTATSTISAGQAQEWNVYPNPADRYLLMHSDKGESLERFEISLFSASGTEVFLNDIDDNKILLPQLSPGVYFIQLVAETSREVVQVVIR